ncbi:hypothetical protein CVU75_00410 [Candidatus Dependentiae bacterium HGW-Dependentiae-1]|nr:MAG: hypothetical protein CVU75_00410 [Candidatus Dependentiae bacterium HGW-Dependentiae-1]
MYLLLQFYSRQGTRKTQSALINTVNFCLPVATCQAEMPEKQKSYCFTDRAAAHTIKTAFFTNFYPCVSLIAT